MEDMSKENPWENKESIFSSSSDMGAENPWAVPEEPALLGIPRGIKTGLTKDLPGVAGKAMQFVAPEGSQLQKVGKSLTEYSEQGLPPEDQQGFWEKGARMVGSVLPMIVASAINPVAGVAAGLGGGALFGLSQAQDTKAALEERGIEPGAAPYLSGAATAIAMTALPMMTGRIFNGTIANLVGKEIASQTAGSVIRPSAAKILQDFGMKALETQLVFAGQTMSVAGIEKAYGVPHEIASEMLESAKTGAAFSLMAAPGMGVRRMVDTSHLKTLSNPWNPEDVAKIPEEAREAYLKKHAENRAGYAEAIAHAIEQSGDKDTANLWREYSLNQIKDNAPIDTTMTLDGINLKSKLLEKETLQTSEIKPADAGIDIVPPKEEVAPEVPKEEIKPEVDYARQAKELGIDFAGMQEGGEKPFPLFTDTTPGYETTFSPLPGESVADALTRIRDKFDSLKEETTPEVKTLTDEQKTSAKEAVDAIFKFEGGKRGKKEIKTAIDELQKNNAEMTSDDLIKEFFKTLKPAVVTEKEVKAGEVGETHNDIEPGAPEQTRGFVTPEGDVLNRTEASQWMKENKPDEYAKLNPDAKQELHSEDLIVPTAEEISSNHERFGTTEALDKTINDYQTMPAEGKLDTAEKLMEHDKQLDRHGKEIMDFCNGKKGIA